MKKIAHLFPGQGAQVVGMGKEFSDVYPTARHTFQEADDLLHLPLSKLVFDGPDTELNQTLFSQLGLFVSSMAMARVLKEQFPHIVPTAVAGLSLGEYTAIAASSRLTFKDALDLVAHRGQFMNDACQEVRGTMAAVLGMEPSALQGAISAIDGVWIANYNCPGQIVISGTIDGVARATARLQEAKMARVVSLTVHGAFHSPLMQGAQDRLAPFIGRAPFAKGSSDLVMNVPGRFVEDSEIQSFMISQVTSPVRWEQGVRALEERKMDLYLEIGSGKTLTAMMRKIGIQGKILPINGVKDLDTLALEWEKCGCTHNC
ncbi:MAG: malonyl CoA-acyl carrier protein transacylase [Chlamydiota bacterium]|jgi:[acyl-carrier-protein] S-malonyltransferase